MNLTQKDHPIAIEVRNGELTQTQLILAKKTAAYEQASLSLNTRKSYGSAWKKFELWCLDNSCSPLPASAETIALYLGSLGGQVSFSSLDSAIAAIEKTHEQRGLSISGDLNLYRRVRRGIRRTHKEKQSVRQAKALSVEELSATVKGMGSTLKELRDKALLTISFFGALRRSEAVALDIEQVEVSGKGLTITLLQSKTSDTAVRVYLAPVCDKSICPVRAFKAWINEAGISSGPLFRPIGKGGKLKAERLSGHAVATIMKERFGSEYSGHSLRRGLATSAAETGTPITKIKAHTRHKSADMVLRYIEQVEGFENTSAKSLGLCVHKKKKDLTPRGYQVNF